MRRKLMAMHSQIVAFEDPLVKSICVEKFGGVDGITDRQYGTAGVKGYDGECTYRQLAAVKNIGRAFYGKGIVKFNEFRFFTGIISDSGGFALCKNLETCIFPPNIKYINRTFGYSYTNKMSRVVMNEGLNIIESFTFMGCFADGASVIIPSTVTYIGDSALSMYSSSKSFSAMIFKPVTPPRTSSNQYATTRCPLYVPDESVELYKSSPLFEYYGTKILPLSEYQP